MITFRYINYDQDIPEVTALMHKGLSKKNNFESFYWKHVLNPFGPSFGLLALDNEKIIGARMFMFWEFKSQEFIYKAIRPVDTIIHPAYRGQGIFKKLTLRGLKECAGSYDLVFNTPNSNSFPGYLRMGWQEMEHKTFFKISFVFPTVFSKKNVRLINLEKYDFSILQYPHNGLITHITPEYLKWRYSDESYKAASILIVNKEILIIYKTDLIKGVKFVIICEVLGDDRHHEKAVKSLLNGLKIYFVFYLDSPLLNLQFRLTLKRKKPVIVFRNDEKSLMEKVQFSAGDLEGRL